MQRAHRRHQPDRPAVAAGGGERLAQLELVSGDVHRCSLGGVRRGCARRAPRRGRVSSGAASRSASRCRSTVASSPRAIGPVSAPAPRSDQLAAVRRTSGASSSRRVLDPGPLEQLGRRLLQRDEEVGGDRGGGVVGGAVVVVDRERAHPEALGERRGRSRERPASEPAIAAGQAVRSLSAVGHGLQRVDREQRGARLAERLERGEGRGAARVAGEARPRHRPRRSPPPPQRSPRRARRGAPRRRPRRPRRRSGVPRAARSARRRSAAVAIEEPTRPAPTIASTWRAASGAVALWVGRSRSSSLIEIPDGGGWFSVVGRLPGLVHALTGRGVRGMLAAPAPAPSRCRG